VPRLFRGGDAIPPARILIVEDDELTALVERATLEAAGFAVEDVRTAEAALARLAATTFDAMVLDLVLPGMRGDELLRRLPPERRQEMPVLIVSGYDDPQQIAGLLGEGAAGYLVKDSRMRFFQVLVQRVSEIVAQR
jgi:two-component system response regulator QseB